MQPLDKHQLWITDDGCAYCIDHIVFTSKFNGRRATPQDYAGHIETTGQTLTCDECEARNHDEVGVGNVYLLFRKNSPDRIQRARDAHPSSGKTPQRSQQKEETK